MTVDPKEALDKFADRILAYKPKTKGMKKRIKKRELMIGSTGKSDSQIKEKNDESTK